MGCHADFSAGNFHDHPAWRAHEPNLWSASGPADVRLGEKLDGRTGKRHITGGSGAGRSKGICREGVVLTATRFINVLKMITGDHFQHGDRSQRFR
jgi:hypothetical protein